MNSFTRNFFLFAHVIALLFSCECAFPDVSRSDIHNGLKLVADRTLWNHPSINVAKMKGVVFSPYYRLKVDLDIFLNALNALYIEVGL